MADEAGWREPRRRGPAPRYAWHLLWAVPLAWAAALVAVFFAGFALCGVSGCSGGGFGVTDTVRWVVPPALMGAALLVGAPFAAVPWGRLRVRLAVGIGLTLVAGGWLAVTFLDMLARAAPPV